MDEKAVRAELDELAAAVTGNFWLSIAIAGALVDAGAVKEADLLETLDSFVDLISLESHDPRTAEPMQRAIMLLEGGTGPLNNKEAAQFTTARTLIEKLHKKKGDGTPSTD